jgi:histidinol-phosphate/aromatic aminotransferase/cobyric acid decarboxylase-like protein
MKMAFREPTLEEEKSMEKYKEMLQTIKHLEQENTRLKTALKDISQGNVSKYDTNFLSMDIIRNETKEHFQERLNTWMQTLAKATLLLCD